MKPFEPQRQPAPTIPKPCPFCGHRDVEPTEDPAGDCREKCLTCGATGPVARAPEAATNLWDRRSRWLNPHPLDVFLA